MSCAAPLEEIFNVEVCDANYHHGGSRCHTLDNIFTVKESIIVVEQDFADEENQEGCLDDSPDTLPIVAVKQNTQTK